MQVNRLPSTPRPPTGTDKTARPPQRQQRGPPHPYGRSWAGQRRAAAARRARAPVYDARTPAGARPPIVSPGAPWTHDIRRDRPERRPACRPARPPARVPTRPLAPDRPLRAPPVRPSHQWWNGTPHHHHQGAKPPPRPPPPRHCASDVVRWWLGSRGQINQPRSCVVDGRWPAGGPRPRRRRCCCRCYHCRRRR